MKKIFTAVTAVLTAALFSFSVFAEEGVRYSNDLTATPLRIFFAILAVVLFVLFEIGIEKLRNKKVAKRNEGCEKEDK